MPDIGNLLKAGSISATERADRAWRRILRSPTTVTLIRGGVAQAEQVVRFEISNSNALFSRGLDSPLGNFSLDAFTLYGVRGHTHPDVPDSDIKRGDRFVLDNKEYTVEAVIYPPGEVQAFGPVRR